MKYHKSSNKNDQFKDLSKIAKLSGGKFKDGEIYLNNSTKMTFIDKLGNEFQSTPDSIKRGSWPPYESDFLILLISLVIVTGKVLFPVFSLINKKPSSLAKQKGRNSPFLLF